MTELLIDHIVHWISISGYTGIVVLMALESMVAPLPSEAVMPFAGFLIFEGKFSFHEVILFSTMGSIIGSVISYYVGLYGGRPFVARFGKYLLLDMHHLELTEKFFNKYGDKTIFISRFVPVVRHLISLPAGAGEMKIAKFILYTALGAGIWNSTLAFAGFHLKSHWEEIRKYSQVVDIAVVVILLLGILYLVYRHLRQTKKQEPQ
ncbi:MAG: DedA family protein [Bacteroidetes bacterium]|nr:DedA family protein [Bacteroidota bacterium]MCL5739255.1 DedA family protein [Bacteroidota bacterium]